jgi:hypothetical protein
MPVDEWDAYPDPADEPDAPDEWRDHSEED